MSIFTASVFVGRKLAFVNFVCISDFHISFSFYRPVHCWIRGDKLFRVALDVRRLNKQLTATYWLLGSFWLQAIFAATCTVIGLLILPETYSPVLLAKKAKKLRKETGNQDLWAPADRTDWSLKGLAHRTIERVRCVY